MIPGQWLWIDLLSPDFQSLREGAYVQVAQDAAAGNTFFTCGWPGGQQLVHLPYEEYGHGWLAYPHRPQPKEVSI